MGDDAFVLGTRWLPGSQVQLAVVTNRFVKIYDLSKDAICPLHNFSLLEDTVRDVTFLKDFEGEEEVNINGADVGERGVTTMLVMSASGLLYTQELYEGGDGGPCILTGTVAVPPHLKGSRGAAVHYSPAQRLILCSYEDKSFAGRLDHGGSTLVAAFPLVTPRLDKSRDRPVPCYHWLDMPAVPGLLVALSRKALQPIALSIQRSLIHLTPLLSPSPARKVEGLATISHSHHRKRDRHPNNAGGATPCHSAIILLDDGSLQRWDVNGAGAVPPPTTSPLPASEPVIADKFSTTTFPVDYFEGLRRITDRVEIGGDILQCYSSEVAKQKLAANDDYIVSPHKDRLVITIHNSDPTLLIAAVRVLVGNASVQHIPSSLVVFDRTITLTAATRRWYDIPFLPSECLLADQQFTLTATAPHNPGKAPLIDSIEIYAMTKAEFRWDSKLLAQWTTQESGAAPVSGSAAVSSAHPALASSLETLACYFEIHRPLDTVADGDEANRGHPTDQEIRATLKEELPSLLNAPPGAPLHRPLRRLLSALHNTAEEYRRTKDLTHLLHLARQVAGGTAERSQHPLEFLTRQVAVLEKVSSRRLNNLTLFLARYPSFTGLLMRSLRRLLARPSLPSSRRMPKALPALIAGIVHVFFAQSLHLLATSLRNDPPLPSVAPALLLLEELLLHPYQPIHTSSVSTLAALLEAPAPIPLSPGDAQYCCDRCTSPIVGERWHCTVCPDYDLCVACHAENNNSSSSPPQPVATEKTTLSPPEKTSEAVPMSEDPVPTPMEEDEHDDNEDGDEASVPHEMSHHMVLLSGDDEEEENEGEEDAGANDAKMDVDPADHGLTPPGVDPDDEDTLLRIAKAASMAGIESEVPRVRGLTLLLPRLLRRCLVEHLLSLANDIRTKGGHVALPFAQQLLLLTSHAVGTDASWDSQHARSLVSALLPRPDLLQIAPTAASPQTEFAILALKIFTALLNPLPTSPTKPVPHSFRIELWHQLKSANLVDFLFSAAKVRNTTHDKKQSTTHLPVPSHRRSSSLQSKPIRSLVRCNRQGHQLCSLEHSFGLTARETTADLCRFFLKRMPRSTETCLMNQGRESAPCFFTHINLLLTIVL